MKQLGYMQAWHGDTGNGLNFMYSYQSRVVDVITATGGTKKVIFGRDAFFSQSTGRQISRYFRWVWTGALRELESAAGRRAAIKRGYTLDGNGCVVDVVRDFGMF